MVNNVISCMAPDYLIYSALFNKHCVLYSLKPGSANLPNKPPVRSASSVAVLSKSLVGKSRMMKRYILQSMYCVTVPQE